MFRKFNFFMSSSLTSSFFPDSRQQFEFLVGQVPGLV